MGISIASRIKGAIAGLIFGAIFGIGAAIYLSQAGTISMHKPAWGAWIVAAVCAFLGMMIGLVGGRARKA